MARYSSYFLATGAGVAGTTTGRPMASLTGSATNSGRVVEIAVANTTATTCQLRIVRITALGTAGAATTSNKYDPSSAAASLTCKQAHSADATFDADAIDGATLGAAIGSGWIWTFGDGGLIISQSTASGIGILPVGTGQICTVKFTWDE
jgi:hypothetical protein